MEKNLNGQIIQRKKKVYFCFKLFQFMHFLIHKRLLRIENKLIKAINIQLKIHFNICVDVI